MRSNLKSLSWTLWLVILAFIGFVFVEWGTGGMSLSGTDSSIAVVEDTPLTGAEYQKDLQMTLDRYRAQFQNNFNKSMIAQLQIPEQVLQRSVNSLILKKEADKLALKVTDEELKDKIKNYTEIYNDKENGPMTLYVFREGFKADGAFIGVREYERRIAQSRRTVKDFESGLREQIIVQKLQELLTSGVVIEPDRLEKMYKEENDRVELDYIVLKTDRIKEDISVQDNELKNYYDENKEEFKSVEKRTGRIIAYNYDNFKSELNVPEKEIYDYFKENKNRFLIPGKTKVSRILLNYNEENREEILKKAEQLRAELTAENFAAKAREMSNDAKATAGGDWGYNEWQRFTKQEKNSIERLKQNEISNPIDTLAGFAVIFLPEKIEERQESYDNVQERIRTMVEKQKLTELVKTKLETVYNKLKDVEDISAKATELGIQVHDTEALSSGQAVSDIDKMGYLSRKLFTLTDKKPAFPVDYMQGVAIVQLNEIVPPAIQPFEEVKDSVKGKVVLEKKLAKLMAEARNVAANLNGKTDDEVKRYLEESELATEEYTYKRGDKLAYFKPQKGLDNTVFALEKGKYSAPVQFATELVIVKPNDIFVSSDEDYRLGREFFYGEKIRQEKANFFSSYILNKRNSYEITYNPELYKKINDFVISRIN
jgi:peptidyl-prolyl cis-trans isomerase D